MHRRNVLAGAAVLAAVAAGLPALSGADEPAGPDLGRFYGQRISWGACPEEDVRPPEGMRCGQVTVPLDYAHPDKGTLRLAVSRIPASGPRKGSLLMNFGGPGAPGIATLAQLPEADLADAREGYDLVAFDPRGVGHSAPISCTEELPVDPKPGGAAPAAQEPAAGDDDLTEVLAELEAAAKECAKHSGPVLPYVGTVHVARDLDVLRGVLGDKKLTYLGISYGTRLGAVYAALFPTRTGRMVLDGVDTLTEPLLEQARVAAQAQQAALDDFLTWCTESASCGFATDARKARELVAELVPELDKMPMGYEDGQEFTGDDVTAAIAMALYSRSLWPTLAQALNDLILYADPTAMTRLGGGGAVGADAGAGAGENGGAGAGGVSPGRFVGWDEVPADNESEALTAVDCADDPDRVTKKQVAELEALRPEFAEISPVFGESRLSRVLSCYGRPEGTDFIREDVKDLRTRKILLIGTRGDPATPYRWAEETARRLGPSAVLLDNRGDGHGGYLSSTCVRDRANAYLMDGSLPHNETSCAAETPDDDEG